MRLARCDSCGKEESIQTAVDLPRGWWTAGIGHDRSPWGGWVFCSWKCVRNWTKGPAPDPRSRVPDPQVYAVPAGYKLVKPPRRVPLAQESDAPVERRKSAGKSRRSKGRR